MVQRTMPIPLSSAAGRAGSSAIRDLLAVAERPDVISLAGGLPAPDGFPAMALAEVIAGLVMDDPGVLQYSTTQGHEPLRAWMAARHGATAGDVVVTNGSQQALDLVVRATVDPGGLIACADPAYVGAVQAFRAAGARLLAVPGDGDGLRVDVLESRLRAGARPALVYVVANFDNPTGATLSLERRRRLAALADHFGFLVVEDDPYGELRWAGDVLPPVAAFTGRAVSLGTISKTLCPGLRVGYLAGPPELVDAVVRLKQATDLHTSTLAQRAVHDLVTLPGFYAAHVAALPARYRTRAEALTAALRVELGDRLDWHEPEGGMFVWARFRDASVDTAALLPVAVEHGVAFVPGAAFAIETPQPDALRLSFATAAGAELRDAVGRVAAAVVAIAAPVG
jgi:2-aminoadipate transaminase